MITRRQILKSTLAGAAVAAGGSVALPRWAMAQAAAGDEFATVGGGSLSIYPVSHASFVMQTPAGVIYSDPVGGADKYAELPAADLVLITHEHGDHFDLATLESLLGDDTLLIVNPAVMAKLPGELRERASALRNGDDTEALGVSVAAIPAYNLAEDRLKYHPKGRDNGYVLDVDGTRVYIGGDTEAIPEMRSLENIDIAFVPMNLPYTMGIEQAAEGVLDFAPGVVYPYHYKGSDPEAFAELVTAGNDAIKVMQGAWYG